MQERRIGSKKFICLFGKKKNFFFLSMSLLSRLITYIISEVRRPGFSRYIKNIWEEGPRCEHHHHHHYHPIPIRGGARCDGENVSQQSIYPFHTGFGRLKKFFVMRDFMLLLLLLLPLPIFSLIIDCYCCYWIDRLCCIKRLDRLEVLVRRVLYINSRSRRPASWLSNWQKRYRYRPCTGGVGAFNKASWGTEG